MNSDVSISEKIAIIVPLRNFVDYSVCNKLSYSNSLRSILNKLHSYHNNHRKLLGDVYRDLIRVSKILAKGSRYRNELSPDLVSVPKCKLSTLKDEKILDDTVSLMKTWIQLSHLSLIDLAKKCKPFWSSKCETLSKHLWLPSEIDSSDQWKQSSVNGFSSISYRQCDNTVPNVNRDTASNPVTDTVLRTRKVRIYPTQAQKQILNEWFDTSRYVYNRFIDAIDNKEYTSGQWKMASGQFVTARNNPNVEEWEKRTPFAVRQNALRDVFKAYKTGFSNKRNGNITHFKIGHRTKKNPRQSIVIPKACIKKLYRKIQIYERLLGPDCRFRISKKENNITINREVRLCKQHNNWYLCIPTDKERKLPVPNGKTCALDPGVVHFQALYDGEKCERYTPSLDKIHRRIDKMKSLLTGNIKSKTRQHMKRRLRKLYDRSHNLVTDLHYRIINRLKGYSRVLLPSFDSQDMVKRSRNRILNRNMNALHHYQFKQRLLCSGIKTQIVNESYTSVTCTSCGHINEKSAFKNRVLECAKCTTSIDRDINGARNIYLKYAR